MQERWARSAADLSVVLYLREFEKVLVEAIPKLGLNEVGVEIAVVSPRKIAATTVTVEKGKSNKVTGKKEKCSDGAGSFDHDERGERGVETKGDISSAATSEAESPVLCSLDEIMTPQPSTSRRWRRTSDLVPQQSVGKEATLEQMNGGGEFRTRYRIGLGTKRRRNCDRRGAERFDWLTHR